MYSPTPNCSEALGASDKWFCHWMKSIVEEIRQVVHMHSTKSTRTYPNDIPDTAQGYYHLSWSAHAAGGSVYGVSNTPESVGEFSLDEIHAERNQAGSPYALDRISQNLSPTMSPTQRKNTTTLAGLHTRRVGAYMAFRTRRMRSVNLFSPTLIPLFSLLIPCSPSF
jgi:hypothetical protein